MVTKHIFKPVAVFYKTRAKLCFKDCVSAGLLFALYVEHGRHLVGLKGSEIKWPVFDKPLRAAIK